MPLELSGAIVLARFAGVVLLAVGVACWMARSNSESRGAISLIIGLVVYDVSVIVLLLLARLAEHLLGIALWSLSCLRKEATMNGRNCPNDAQRGVR